MLRVRVPLYVTSILLLALLAAQSGQAVPVKAASSLAAQRSAAAQKIAADAGFYNQPTDQVIVKYKTTVGIMKAAPESASQAQRLSQTAGESVTYLRAMSGGAHVLKLAGKRPVADV